MKKVSLKTTLITGMLVVTSQSVFAEKVYDSDESTVSAESGFYYSSERMSAGNAAVKAENILTKKCRDNNWPSADRISVSGSPRCIERNGEYKCTVILKGYCYGYSNDR